MVEGEAENILIPVIADILGYPLEKYGVSIVRCHICEILQAGMYKRLTILLMHS